MKVSIAATYALSALAAMAIVGGGALGATHQRAQHANASASTCTPKVWVSDPSANAVYGYKNTDAPGVECPLRTLTGALPSCGGGAFNAPSGLATDNAGDLYVADQNNDRIVEFNPDRTACNIFTVALSPASSQPRAVCAYNGSSGVILGVVTGYTGGADGAFAFYNVSPVFGHTAYGRYLRTYTSFSALPRPQYCAFDASGNFFVDGFNAAGAAELYYLTYANVILVGVTTPRNAYISADPNEAMTGGVASFRSSGADTITLAGASPYTRYASGATCTPGPYCQDFQMWSVKPGTASSLAFTGPKTCTLTDYKSNSASEWAPLKGAAGSAPVYIAGSSAVWSSKGVLKCINQAPHTRANVKLYTTTPTGMQPVGVTANPDGQY